MPAVKGSAPVRALTVERGTFRPRYLLTGELEAAEAVHLTVPQSPSWRVEIRWMEEDGVRVTEGQKVLELDNSSFVKDLEDKRLSVAEHTSALERARVRAESAVAEDEHDVERRRSELEKARLDASVPVDLLPERERQERQLAVRRAELELAKALEQLEATRQVQKAEIAMRRIELEQARREVAVAEEAIAAMTVTSPTGGVLVVEQHPWEERKLQVGDSVWIGLPVMRLPDLATLEVEAVLPDVDEARVVEGLEAFATPDAFPHLRLPGRIESVAPVARQGEAGSLVRYFEVRVAIDLARAGAELDKLRPGMSVKVEVLGEPREGVLLASRSALDLSVEPPRAILADGTRRDLLLGPCNPTHCVVEEGLTGGERLAALVAPPAGRGGDR